MADEKFTLNDYLGALRALGAKLYSDARGALPIGDKEKKENAAKLIAGYQEYVRGKEGAADTVDFDKWLAEDAKADAALKSMKDDAAREAAKAEAKSYLANDDKVKKARAAIFKDGRAIFDQASGALGGNLIPGLVGIVPLLLSMFGLMDIGGTFGALAMGAVAFLATGAITDPNSIGGQAWSWIKKTTGLGNSREPDGPAPVPATPERAQVRALAGAAPEVVIAEVGQININGERRTVAMKGVIPAGQTIRPGTEVTFREYVVLDADGKETGIRKPIGELKLPIGADNKVPVTPDAGAISALTGDYGARVQADFLNGKVRVRTDAAARTVTVTSEFDAAMERTYRGEIRGNDFVLTEVQVIKEGATTPTFEKLPDAKIKTITGVVVDEAGVKKLDAAKLAAEAPQIATKVKELSGTTEELTMGAMGVGRAKVTNVVPGR